MKKTQIALAGVAAAFLFGSVGASLAQGVDPADPNASPSSHHSFKKLKYRTLNVTPRAPMAAAESGGPGAAVGAALAAPAYAVGGVGGPVGVAGNIAGGTIAGATSLAFAPLGVLTGGGVGISGMAAPPLPIVARYEKTGKVASTYDEGYSKDVPVDNSGPIYKLNYKESGERTVTPFSLIALPITEATYAVTSPFHPATP